jgi:SAM-dependent methyltransferase
MVSMGGFASYDLYDVGNVPLEAAKRHANAIGVGDKVNCVCADIHKVDLVPDSYDVITFIASLHHIDDLDRVLAKCRNALKPGGKLWAVEYIGPDRFQYPDEHTQFAKQFYRSVHPGLKKLWCPELTFPTAEDVIREDPTESVHSSDIPRAINATFAEVDTLYTYGTFAFILFWSLLYDALYEAPMGFEFVDTVMELDELLIDAGRLPHYFAYFVAGK